MLLIVLGLCLFETISSIDNAIINAEVLSKTGQKARKWFLSWGLLFSVFAVRGLLPWVIIWATLPSLGPIGALTATFSNDPHISMGGGAMLEFIENGTLPGIEALKKTKTS